MDQDLLRSILGAKLRLRSKSPFFTVLLGHLQILELSDTDIMPTAATDGKRLWVNKKFWFSISTGEREFVLAHEALHAAMGHCWRVGQRDSIRWNLAADFVVDLILHDAGFQILRGALFDVEFREMTVEEVYALLKFPPRDAWAMAGDVRKSGGNPRELDQEWRAARAAARTAEKMFGKHPLGHKIEVLIEDPSLNWRDLLWKSISWDNSDFKDWDRRLLHDEVYIEDLQEEESPQEVAIFIDTSGSVVEILGHFVAEVKSLCNLYGHEVPVYWVDAALIGPIPLSKIDKPLGGGGTSFVPAFEEVEKQGYRHVVYLTDLCGTFPQKAPDAWVLWVVPAGTTLKPPFGAVAKILGVDLT